MSQVHNYIPTTQATHPYMCPTDVTGIQSYTCQTGSHRCPMYISHIHTPVPQMSQVYNHTPTTQATDPYTCPIDVTGMQSHTCDLGNTLIHCHIWSHMCHSYTTTHLSCNKHWCTCPPNVIAIQLYTSHVGKMLIHLSKGCCITCPS